MSISCYMQQRTRVLFMPLRSGRSAITGQWLREELQISCGLTGGLLSCRWWSVYSTDRQQPQPSATTKNMGISGKTSTGSF